MKGWLPLTLGLLAVVLGTVWTVQGLGYVAGSMITGVRIWAFLGPILALSGVVLIWYGLHRRRQRS